MPIRQNYWQGCGAFLLRIPVNKNRAVGQTAGQVSKVVPDQPVSGEPAPRPLGIAHIYAPGAGGGVERVVHSLAEGLVRRGHGVHVVAVMTVADTTDVHGPLREAGVVVREIHVPGRAYRRELLEVQAVLGQAGASVVHTHGYRPDVLHGLRLTRTSTPVVTTLHGFTGGGFKNRLYELAQRRAARRFDAVVAVSRPLGALLERTGVPENRIFVVPNAWGGVREPPEDREVLRTRWGVGPGQFHIGWVGRMSHEKGADVLLSAVARLTELPVMVSLIGDGPERSRLETEHAGLVQAGRIRFHGGIYPADRCFTAFDAFVLSSRTEGTPIVLFEAMASGAPVVATMVGGVPDVVSDEEATLVPSEDPEALAQGIRRVFTDRAGAVRRAAAASRRLETHFGVDRWLDGYQHVYREVLKRKGRARNHG